jgi:death-on-curing protein
VSAEPEWLAPAVVVAVQRALIAEHGGADGIRDRGLLDSTLFRPRNLLAYGETPPDVFDLAASYAYGLAKNHGFVDGNKRIALTAALLFLELNGWRLQAPSEERYVTTLGLASGEVSEADFGAWLRRNSVGT